MTSWAVLLVERARARANRAAQVFLGLAARVALGAFGPNVCSCAVRWGDRSTSDFNEEVAIRWRLNGRGRLLAIALAVAVAAAGRAQYARAAFPGSNGMIAFASNRDDSSNFEIYSMDSNGVGVTRLTNNSASDIEPAWSPDGTKIAFTSSRSGNSDIWIMNGDGSNPTQLTTDTGSDFGAAWSPDGTKIAFTSTRNGGRYDIFVMNADGTGQTNLTNDSSTNELQPAWSPDGAKIAYTSDKDGGDFDVWVMNADGTGQTDLTQTGVGVHEQNPNWSPDGSQITFESNADGYSGVFVMNADGSGSTDVSGPVGAGDPAWSPDGNQITFIEDYDVWVMNADGTGQVNVTNNASGVSAQNPDWGPTKVPTDRNQCKNSGWQTLVRTDGTTFKNQGDCVQYVNTGK